MNGHHLILGQTNDFLTGEILQDTHDERYRQKIARMLVEEKGYTKTDFIARKPLKISAGEHHAIIHIELLAIISGKTCMVIKYGPGSLVTRIRPVLAISRLIEKYQIPVAVITNGEDAVVLNALSGKTIGNGLASIPSKNELISLTIDSAFHPIPSSRAEMESRIVYAYEVDGACPCDDTICRLEPTTTAPFI